MATATRAFITGANGFAGRYLMTMLTDLGYDVTASTLHGEDIGHGSTPLQLDVSDAAAVTRAIADVGPDEVYHLAGLTRPGSDAVRAFYDVNLRGALNLLEAVRTEAPEARTLIVGSAYAYGIVEGAIDEDTPLSPVNHYGSSKAAADILARVAALEGSHVVRARPFNHSGPGQPPDFLLPSLISQFADIIAGRAEPVISIGNLDSVRDFSDVRDIVRGYHLALQVGTSGAAYNFGSGVGHTVQALYDLIAGEAGVPVELRVEPARVRANDISYLVADISRARRELGWSPTISLETTIRDMLAVGVTSG